MKLLLDTDGVSFALRGHDDVGTRRRERKPSEIRFGTANRADCKVWAPPVAVARVGTS
jgi:hypothetical protein